MTQYTQPPYPQAIGPSDIPGPTALSTGIIAGINSQLETKSWQKLEGTTYYKVVTLSNNLPGVEPQEVINFYQSAGWSRVVYESDQREQEKIFYFYK